MWIMTSKRYKGGPGRAPFVDFLIGQVRVAQIVMNGQKGEGWEFELRVNTTAEDLPSTYPTFAEALKDMHRLLKLPAPEGYETRAPKKQGDAE